MLTFNLDDSTFDYEKYYSYEKEKGGGQEYILHYLLGQPWIHTTINFWESDEQVLLIKGAPIDKNLPLSPIDSGYMDSSSFKLVRDFILTFHRVINLISYAYIDENKGGLFRSLVPVKNEEDMVGSHGSKFEFKLHSDNPTYHLYPEYVNESLNSPEFLSLFCLRGQENVKTNIVILKDIINDLEQDTINILKQNIFTVNTPDSFDKYHQIDNLPVLLENNNKVYSRYDYHNIKASSKEAKEALDKFRQAAKNTLPISLSFESGNFLIFKNQEVLHSRESFNAKYDGFDRWILRIYSMATHGYLKHNNILIGGKECL